MPTVGSGFRRAKNSVQFDSRAHVSLDVPTSARSACAFKGCVACQRNAWTSMIQDSLAASKGFLRIKTYPVISLLVDEMLSFVVPFTVLLWTP